MIEKRGLWFFVLIVLLLSGCESTLRLSDISGKDCGGTLITDYVLSDADPIVGSICSGDGLIIGADNIVLDCDGYTLTGENVEQIGIKVEDVSGVEVKNCKIENFGEGIYINDAEVVLEDNELRNNYVWELVYGDESFTGVLVEGVSEVEMNDNIVCDNDVDFSCGADSVLSGGGNTFADFVECGDGWPVYKDNYRHCEEDYVCGGDEGVCGCGATLADSHVLSDADPITWAACDEIGLIIDRDGATLDCDGYTLKGVNGEESVGLYIVDGAKVENCKIENFRDGITVDTAGEVYMENNEILNNYWEELGTKYGAGISIIEDGAEVFIDNNIVCDNNIDFDCSKIIAEEEGFGGELSPGRLVAISGAGNEFDVVEICGEDVNVHGDWPVYSDDYTYCYADDEGEDDSGNGGGGNGGDDDEDEVCEEDWSCAGWGECVSSVQTRECIDLNSCGTEDDMPSLSQSCEVIIVETGCTGAEDCETGYDCIEGECILEEIIEDEETSLFWVITIPLLIFLAILGVILFFKYRRREEMIVG